MNKERRLICTGINDRFAWPWMVSIFSAKLHSNQSFDVGLGTIKGNLSSSTRALLEQFCEKIKVNLIHKEFDFNEAVQVDSRVTAEAYLRLLWMDYLDSDFMWLDSDTLPLANWDRIFEDAKIEGSSTSIVFAAEDLYTTRWSDLQQDNEAIRLAGKSYFNSGVLLARPNIWKAKNYDSLWKSVGRDYLRFGFKFWDQDILNYVLRDEKTIISSDYNFLVPVAPENVTARILHFTSTPKPWFLSERDRNYFLACEILGNRDKNKSTFMAPGWEIHYENYYRHENAMLNEFSDTPTLQKELLKCANDCRKPMLGKKDNIKLIAMNLEGHKWF